MKLPSKNYQEWIHFTEHFLQGHKRFKYYQIFLLLQQEPVMVPVIMNRRYSQMEEEGKKKQAFASRKSCSKPTRRLHRLHRD